VDLTTDPIHTSQWLDTIPLMTGLCSGKYIIYM